MEGGILIFLCFTMLLGSFIAGMLPLTLNLSETKMRHITILGAGLLIGTALAVIVPEGVHTLYANQKCINNLKETDSGHHVHKRDLSWMNQPQQEQSQHSQQSDTEAINFFLKMLSRDKNLSVRSLSNRWSNNQVDVQRMQSFIAQRNQQQDQEAMRLFLAQISSDKNLNLHRLVRRIADSNELTDAQKIEMFLASLNNNRVIKLDDAMIALQKANLSSRDLLEIVAKHIESEDVTSESNFSSDDREDSTESRPKRDLFGNAGISNQQHDVEAVNFFLKMLSRDKNLSVRSLSNRWSNNRVDVHRMQSFIAQRNQQKDQEAMRLFLAQISADKNLNLHRLVRRIAETNELTDAQKIEMFMASLNNNRVIKLDDAMVALQKANLSARDLLEIVARNIETEDVSNESTNSSDEQTESLESRPKRDLSAKASISNQQHDLEAVNFFLKMLSRDKNIYVRSLGSRWSNNQVDVQRMQSFIAQRNQQIDQEAMRLFLAQISADKNLNLHKLVRRIADSSELTDAQKIEMFLASLNNNRVIKLDDAMVALQKANLSARDLLGFIANQIDNSEPELSRSKRELPEQSKESKTFDKESPDSIRKDPVNVVARDSKLGDVAANQVEHEHGTESAAGNSSHSAIGVTLVLGFVFMLFIDQISGKIGHRHQTLDSQSIRNKITFSTTLGLIVHAAADGIALGAAAATSKTDIEMIVFFAIMLHKAPAAFGLVSFLIHEGLDRARVRKHLAIFALAAPIMAIVTYVILKSGSNVNMVTSDSTGLCMLFSAGTFLYVSTVHVLPEVQSHNEDRQFRFAETMSFVVGAVIPLFLTVGHGH